jgi:hypothetical protein
MVDNSAGLNLLIIGLCLICLAEYDEITNEL